MQAIILISLVSSHSIASVHIDTNHADVASLQKKSSIDDWVLTQEVVSEITI